MTDHGELVEIVAEAVRPWMDGSAEYVARAAIGALDLPARDRRVKRELIQEWRANALLQVRYADEVSNELDVVVWNTIAILMDRCEGAYRVEDAAALAETETIT